MAESIALRALKVLPLLFLLSVSATHAASTNSFNLVTYVSGSVQDPADESKIPKYNRLKHFGAWAHQDATNRCFDTRETVLARDGDPSVPMTYGTGGCTIKAGLWHDPYTGTDLRDATQVQIDHVVPLKAAYYAGAYSWDAPLRCNYANFIANRFHLASVSGHENMSKGDRGPEGYLPPDHKDRCSYISNWMKIKAIWELTTTADEVAAIRGVIDDENCDNSYLVMDRTELTEQRRAANTPIAACADFGN